MQTDADFRTTANATARAGADNSSAHRAIGDAVFGRAVGYGLLALGCMKKYVRRRQYEIGSLEALVAKALYQLSLTLDETSDAIAGVGSTSSSSAAAVITSTSTAAATAAAISTGVEEAADTTVHQLAAMSLNVEGANKTKTTDSIGRSSSSSTAALALSLVTRLDLLHDFRCKDHPDVPGLVSASCLDYEPFESSSPVCFSSATMTVKETALILSQRMWCTATETSETCRGVSLSGAYNEI
jgi:hypothetical protein